MQAASEGRDVLLVMPTGAGKSLCYQLPAMIDERLTVVVSPLVSLMTDQVESLGDRAALINAQRDRAANLAAFDRALAGEAKLLYVAPERFATPGFTDRLAAARIGLFVVDEAHCVSQWGHDFRPEYLRLGEVARALGAGSIFAATATATPRVAGDVIVRLGLRDPVKITTGFDRPNLSYDVVRVRSARSKREATLALLREPDSLPAIVYAGTRKKTEETAAWLSRELGVSVPGVSRRHGARPASRGAAGVHVGREPGGRRHQRLRHGRRQGRRADGDPRGGAVVARGLLPGGRPRGARRTRLALRAAGREPRQGPARVLHQPGRRPRRRSGTAGASTARSGASSRVQTCRRAAILRHFGDRADAAGAGALLRRLRRAAGARARPQPSGSRDAGDGDDRRRRGDHRGGRRRRTDDRAYPRGRDPARRAQQGGASSTATTVCPATATFTTGAPTTCCARSTR